MASEVESFAYSFVYGSLPGLSSSSGAKCKTARLADPYRDCHLDYSTQEHCKAQEQEGLLVYQHETPTELAFTGRDPHRLAFHQRHQQPQHATPATMRTTGVPSGIHDVHQPVLLDPHQMVAPHLSPHYGSTSLQYPQQRGEKRPSSDNERRNDDDRRMGIHLQMLPAEAHEKGKQSPELLLSAHSDSSSHRRTSAHTFANPLPTLHQPHHHHRLPSQAIIHPSQSSGVETTTQSGLPSVVGQVGMPEPAPRPRGPKLKFTPEEDALLVELKEHKNLTWKQIADFFPGRTSGTLQVRYCTKLKAKDTIWTDEMVQRLRNAVQDYENDRWRIIAAKVGHGFTPAACREKATEL